jgi:hypothetical protein
MNWGKLFKYHKDLMGLIKEPLGDEPRKKITRIRFPEALLIKSGLIQMLSLSEIVIG